MKRSELKRKAPMAHGTSTLARSVIKKKAPKRRPGYHDKPMLESCRGETCYLRVPAICPGEAARSTVVPCHSNDAAHGKGMGIKAKDKYSVPGCMHCHAWLDQGPAGREVKRATFDEALARWEPVRARKLSLKEKE